MNDQPLPSDPTRLPIVDIELVLEGSYPFVTGGVSKWVHDLLEGLPQFSFGIIHLASRQEEKRTLRYQLPSNVHYLQNVYLHDPVFLYPAPEINPFKAGGFFPQLKSFHENSHTMDGTGFATLLKTLTADTHLPFIRNLFFCEPALDMLESMYLERNPDASYIDFFWTWRYMHLPIIQLLQARRGPTGLVHTISTGYAGYYAALRKYTEGTPVILTEHGIYTRERNIEITQAEWIHSEKQPDHLVRTTKGTFKKLWIEFFETLGHWTYEAADRIVTLFEGNRTEQIRLGAAPQKTMVIPNGILPNVFLDLRPEAPPDPNAFHVGFVGRVVPIKDVATLLSAAQMCLMNHPQASFHIIGPLDEDPEYAREMRQFADTIKPAGRIFFHGRQNVREWYPKLDVCVLTSVSEGQPLSIMETMAAGIPTVTTDIGGCSELIFGRSADDKALGPCGVVTSLRSPEQTAQGIAYVCADPSRYLAMVRAGKKRVMQYYQQSTLLESYSALYTEFLSAMERRKRPR